MRPRVPNRRNKNPSAIPPTPVPRSQGEDSSSSMNGFSNISQGYSGTAAKVLPLMPKDSRLVFELLMFGFVSIALMLQYLHLYRSVWWLQHSYNHHAVNFYLIDPILIVFSTIILGRRLVWTLLKCVLLKTLPPSWAQSFIIVLRSVLTMVVLFALLIMTYIIVNKYNLVNILYLAYPVSLYFILFGFHGEPFLELLPNLSEASLKDNKNVRLFLDNEGIHQCTSMGSNYTGPIPITPESTRLEVQVQRNDFNARLKQIMFNTLISTYYATFIPCVFTPSALSFELFWVVKHSVTVFFGCGTLYFIHLYPSDYIHMMHRTAKNLGQWGQIEGRISHAFYSTWSPTQVWPINSFVRVDKSLYKSEGLKNCAEPGNLAQFRFYTLFNDPMLVLGVILCGLVSMILMQHVSLAYSAQWYQMISEATLLFANYYSLFKLVRDYIVFMKLTSETSESKKDN